MADICPIKSITLLPGETFVLPKGATILGASGMFQSTCEMPELEAMVCYTCMVAYKGASSGTRFYENGSDHGIEITGYQLNGVDYLLDKIYTPDNSGGMFAAARFNGEEIANDMALRLGAIDKGHDNDDTEPDKSLYIHLQIIPSVGDKLFIKTNVHSTEVPGRITSVYYPFVLTSTLPEFPNSPCGVIEPPLT